MAEDRIHLRGMVFYGYHGDRAHEREAGQRFIVDLEVYSDLKNAGLSDRLEDTIDYGDIYRLVKEIVEGPSKTLLEGLAEDIAGRVLDLEKVTGVRIMVKKPGVTIKSSILDYAAIEIERHRS